MKVCKNHNNLVFLSSHSLPSYIVYCAYFYRLLIQYIFVIKYIYYKPQLIFSNIHLHSSCPNNNKVTINFHIPELINDLGNTVITDLSCGARHSLALSEWGQLYSWGHNDYGQLALPDSSDVVRSPKIVKKLAAQTIIQIATGYNHSLALTNC